MGEPLLTALSIENHHHQMQIHHHHHPSTLLTMDSTGPHLTRPLDCARSLLIQSEPSMPSPVDINQPVYVERSPPPPSSANQWPADACDMLDVGLGSGSQIFDPKSTTSNNSNSSNNSASRKCAKRGDSIWGAWFFFNYYFKPVLSEKSKGKTITRDANGFAGYSKSDLNLDVFLVQHDMENMYMWVFKERPENALGKMQLRSFMNGHSRLGEPQFPFSVEKGFVRSHRMQRKHYRGLSNPQCLHGIEVVRSPNLTSVSESDLKKWFELTGREVNFLIPLEASDFESWRNLPSTDFELERPQPLKNTSNSNNKKLLNGSGLNLSTHGPTNHNSTDGMDTTPICSGSKRRKDCSPHAMEEDLNQEIEINPFEPPWTNDFSGVMRHACGPVTASKTIYEDDEGYLIMVSLPFTDLQRVKVSWRNTLTFGIVKISCVSVGRMPYVKRHDRTFKLTDPSPEHCAPGEFVREIPLATRIPEDAKLEAYYDETGTGLEIMVPKHRVGPEEHEVHVSMRPPQSWN
ncbi:HSP20-like chaperones superfamily protein [Rhynchospora pubera]|uniref:HSP20-like chaperones superfamily protein n=1 Tax=Rhynchospora pubera TaxID=906938 RepID=A0AAV8HPQ9_9POAL|nr:HSP20-like chaperones superfamily protein [Rhynchospora pubera]